MLYAAAAVLEGCSFVNGGSQNTMCPALFQLAEVGRARWCWCSSGGDAYKSIIEYPRLLVLMC